MRKRLCRLLPLLLIATVLAVGGWRRSQAGSAAGQPFVARQLDQSRRIISALRSYADSHGGTAPDSLEVLVIEGRLRPEDLTINLMDGLPPVRWIYLKRVPRKYPSLILMSPALTNDAGDLTRLFRRLIGDPPLPWQNKRWILADLDGSAEAFSEAKLRTYSKLHGLDIRGISESNDGRPQS